MKKLLLLVAIMLCCAMTMFAQNNKISYQAVVRDTANRLVANKTVEVTVSIFNGDAQTAAYSETQTTTTNLNGLISLLVGNGTVNSGNWELIDWKIARIETAVALNGTSLGTLEMPFTAVPYAMYAEYADEIDPEAAVVTGIYNKILYDSLILAGQINTVNANLTNKINADSLTLRNLINGNTSEINNLKAADNALSTRIANDSANLKNNYTTTTDLQNNYYTKTQVNENIDSVKGNIRSEINTLNNNMTNNYATLSGTNAFTSTNNFSGTNNFTGSVTVPTANVNLKTATYDENCNNNNAVNVCDLLAVFDSLNRAIASLKQMNNELSQRITVLENSIGGEALPSNTFDFCYDCSRNPAYPKKSSTTNLSGFGNPLVGYKGIGFNLGNTSEGPWKVEFVDSVEYNSTSTYISQSLKDNLKSNYYSSVANPKIPVYQLYQWNNNTNQYEHAAYGVICAYSSATADVDHTAMFIEGQHQYGCFLTSHAHSGNLSITFTEDLSDNLPSLPPTADVTTPPTATTTATAGSTTALVSAGAATNGTMMYAVTTTNTSAPEVSTFSATVPTAEGRTAGTFYVWYYAKGNSGYNDSQIEGPVTVTVTTYITVSKGSSGFSSDHRFYYTPGESYKEALVNHPDQNAGWKKWEGYHMSQPLHTLYYKEGSLQKDLYINNDSNFAPNMGSCSITLDSPIDPTGLTFVFSDQQ